jgi:hypothetical protein
MNNLNTCTFQSIDFYLLHFIPFKGSDGVNRTFNDSLQVASGEWQVLFLSYMGKNGVVNMKVRRSDRSWIDGAKKTGFDLPIWTWGDFLLGASIYGHQYFTGTIDCMLLFDEALHKHEVGKAIGLCNKAGKYLASIEYFVIKAIGRYI